MGFNEFMVNNIINPVAGAVNTAANATVPVVMRVTNPVVTPVAQGMSAAVTGTEKLLYGDPGMSDKDLDAHQANDAYVMSKVQSELHKGEDVPYKVVTNPKVLLDAEDFVPVVGCAHRISNIVEDAQQNKSATDDGVNAGIDCVADAAAAVTFGAGEALKGTKVATFVSTAVPGTHELVKVGAGERLTSHLAWNGVMGVGIKQEVLPQNADPEPELDPEPSQPDLPKFYGDDAPTPVGAGRVERATPVAVDDELVVVHRSSNMRNTVAPYDATAHNQTQSIALAILLASAAWALASVKF